MRSDAAMLSPAIITSHAPFPLSDQSDLFWSRPSTFYPRDRPSAFPVSSSVASQMSKR
jgi:hypothetical protein